MIMDAVLAVALGIAPVDTVLPSRTTVVDAREYKGLIGRYQQATDSSGITHLTGFDRRNGRPFDIAVSTDGRVEGSVGDMYVTFSFSKAA